MARQGGSSITRALRVVEAVAVAGDGVTAKAIARRRPMMVPNFPPVIIKVAITSVYRVMAV